MSRHIVHVEAKGFPSPWRLRRQRQILDALATLREPLSEQAGGAPVRSLRPILSFGFPPRTPPAFALAEVAELLDHCDRGWRAYLTVWDVLRGKRSAG